MISGMPPLQWLATFQAVIEAGSFAGAAKMLHLTPSAISHQMRALEGMLGQALFLRNKRQVTPTEEAMAYASTISESFARLMAATTRLSTGSGARRLPIHCSPSFATLWLGPHLKSFMRDHPSIDLAIFASHEPARLGQDGIMIDIQYARPVPETCEAVVLAQESVVPLASPAFVREHALVSPADISRVPLLHSLRCVAQWAQWSARFVPGVAMNTRGFQFDRAHLALVAASDGLGLALESTLQAHSHLSRNTLVMPFGPLTIPIIAHRLVYQREDSANPDIKAFVAWITRTLRTANPALTAVTPETQIRDALGATPS